MIAGVTSGSRPYHHGNLRPALISAAIGEIEESGPAAMSLRAVARRAGVTHAAATYHFGDRAGLLTAVAAEGYRLLTEALRAAQETRGSFLEVGVAYVRFAVTHRAHFEVMYRPELYHRDDAELGRARAAAATLLYGTGETTRERMAYGVAAWSIVHGLATLWLNGNLPAQLGDDPEEITRVVAAHLGPPRRDPALAAGNRGKAVGDRIADSTHGGKLMPYVRVGEENSGQIEIYYEDHGRGRPVVLIHGYPLNGHSWEKQLPALLDAGYRVIAYDRRGFGASSQPTVGYDYDTFAADLRGLMDVLDLRDVTLAGFSMGTGEVTRYLGRYGSERIRNAVLLGPIPPFLLKTGDNPEGVNQSVFDGLIAAARADRYAYFKDFFDNFYNVDKFRGTRISDQAWQASFNVAAGASAYASVACIPTWLTDFRADLPQIDVPILVVQGTEDRILPIDATGWRLPALLKDACLIEVEAGPHNIGWTHPQEVNRALLGFLAS